MRMRNDILGLMRAVLPIAMALVASIANAPEKTTKETLGSSGLTRTYHLFVPDSALFPLAVVRATRDALNSHGFDAQLTEITNHTHWYYDRAAEINIKVWAFLQKARLAGEPKYQRYQIAPVTHRCHSIT
jgi:hypothetical protein